MNGDRKSVRQRDFKNAEAAEEKALAPTVMKMAERSRKEASSQCVEGAMR